MRTRYSEDQQAVGEAFGDLFAREATPEAVRSAAAGCGFDRALWDKLASAGAPGMAAPVTYGGGGASLVDLAVVVYEWGRRIAPVPLVEHAVSTRLLCTAASSERAARIFARAWSPASSSPRSRCGRWRPTAQPGSFPRERWPMWWPASARELWFSAAASRPARARPNTADLPLADRDLSDAEVIATDEAARRAWNDALTEWKALMAVAYAGLASEVLAMGVAYVKQRHQFGVPVGSFQAVQHGLADAATRAEGARLLAFRAACAVDAGQTGGDRLASMALLFGAESARFASDRVLQYHGGYGYSAEYDVQLYYRRAAAWLLQLGEPAAEMARLAEADLGPKARAA